MKTISKIVILFMAYILQFGVAKAEYAMGSSKTAFTQKHEKGKHFPVTFLESDIEESEEDSSNEKDSDSNSEYPDMKDSSFFQTSGNFLHLHYEQQVLFISCKKPLFILFQQFLI